MDGVKLKIYLNLCPICQQNANMNVRKKRNELFPWNRVDNALCGCYQLISLSAG